MSQTAFEPKFWALSPACRSWGLSSAGLGETLPMVGRVAVCSEERKNKYAPRPRQNQSRATEASLWHIPSHQRDDHLMGLLNSNYPNK